MNQAVKNTKISNNQSILFLLKKDYIVLTAIFIFFIINIISFWGYNFYDICDFGREVFIIQQMLEGKILYKDIHNLYGPLPYQLNTLYAFILGLKLNTFFIISTINSFIIALFIYLIARNISTSKIAGVSTFLVISLCFNHFEYNSGYLAPYTYTITYGLIFYLASLYFLIQSIKFNHQRLFYLSAFFASCAMLSKYEFFILIILYLIALTLFSPVKNINYLKLLASFLIAPIASHLVILFQGAKISDLLNHLTFIFTYSFSSETRSIYQSMGVIPSVENIIETFKILIIFSITGILFITISNFICSLLSPSKVNKKALNFIIPLTGIISGIIFLGFSIISGFFNISLEYFESLSTFLPLTSILILSLLTINEFKNNHNKPSNLLHYFQNPGKKKKMLYLIILAAILLSVKIISHSTFYNLGSYLNILNIIICVYFSFVVISKIFKKHKTTIKYSLIILFIFIGTVNYANNLIAVRFLGGYKVETIKGTFYTRKILQKNFQNIHDYLTHNVSKGSTVRSLPAYMFINYVTDKQLPSNYLYIDQPTYIIAIGEENILEDLQKHPADYFIVLPEAFSENFKNTYEKQFIATILKNYERVDDFKHTSELQIFKLKTTRLIKNAKK